MGRPAKTAQPEYGAHLAKLRNASSLSQQQLADIIGVRQATVAAWERSPTPPRGEFLLPLSEALGVTLEQLLACGAKSPNKRGPASKLDSLVSDIIRLPRRRQQRITRMIEALIAQEANS